jgi:acyl-CoA synthetase (AMP-forming)/AMP-acid ligase II
MAAPAPDLLDLLGRSGGSGTALEDVERTVSYRDLATMVRRRAAALARHGVSPGDRVVVVAPNSAASVELFLACLLLGAIWVGVNPTAPPAERDRQSRLVRPALIVADAPTAVPEPAPVVDLAAVLDEQSGEFLGTTTGPADSPCSIAFTSGTTGTPKAVVHSRAAVSLSAAALAATKLTHGDRIGVVLPLSIHNVIVVAAMAALFAGATAVVVDTFTAAAVAAACRDWRLTVLTALVPATIYDMVHDESIAPTALSSLRYAGAGAAGLSEQVRKAFEEKFDVRLVFSYGMTEAPGAVCLEDPDADHREGSSGVSLPHVVVGAVDEDGRPLARGQEGRLRVCPTDSGPWAGLFRPPIGQWIERGLVHRSSTDCCLDTGDYGWVELDGSVHISGRAAHVIVRGGVNVSAGELESILAGIAGVREIAVVGEPDERLGERIVAYVEMSVGAETDINRLRDRARNLLSHGKVPDEFVVVDTLPRNAMGKVVRPGLVRPTRPGPVL